MLDKIWLISLEDFCNENTNPNHKLMSPHFQGNLGQNQGSGLQKSESAANFGNLQNLQNNPNLQSVRNLHSVQNFDNIQNLQNLPNSTSNKNLLTDQKITFTGFSPPNSTTSRRSSVANYSQANLVDKSKIQRSNSKSKFSYIFTKEFYNFSYKI